MRILPITRTEPEVQAAQLDELFARFRDTHRISLVPLTIFISMVCAVLLLDAILPLRAIGFYSALITRVASWTLLPANILFPGQPVVPVLPYSVTSLLPLPPHSLNAPPLLFSAFLLLTLVYLLALRLLPAAMRHATSSSCLRYLFVTTTIFGLIYVLVPVLTSTDIFSYITYARLGVIYHLNPLTTLPIAISHDANYPYLYWIKQPSAYGPTWIAITCLLQWLTLRLSFSNILAMVFALRIFGLLMHLGSTWLIWSISGRLQRSYGAISPTNRLRAALAFAWNPLLLFEACVNAHNDTTVLFFLLLAIWFLVRTSIYSTHRPGYLHVISLLPAVAMFALATCVKINLALLFPGLLLFLYMQQGPWLKRLARVLVIALAYTGSILLLYAPFWQGGAVLTVFRVNPATSRDVNTLYDFLSQLYNSIITAHGARRPPIAGSPAEHFTHNLSIYIFVIVYALLIWSALRSSHRLNTLPALIHWWTLAWLLYCALGASWFWPWYIVTFFGLYALVESMSTSDSFAWLRLPLAARLLAFSMLSVYCFYTWIPLHTYVPYMPSFLWEYFRGLWVWLVPLIALRFPFKRQMVQSLELDRPFPPLSQEEMPALTP